MESIRAIHSMCPSHIGIQVTVAEVSDCESELLSVTGAASSEEGRDRRKPLFGSSGEASARDE